MNRQKLLDTFVRKTHGKGRAADKDGNCLYFPNNHPGCAIGCQTGFKKQFEDVIKSRIKSVTKLFNSMHAHIFRAFFDVKEPEDEVFLQTLQALHDQRYNWYQAKARKGILKTAQIAAFARKWNLKMPPLPPMLTPETLLFRGNENE